MDSKSIIRGANLTLGAWLVVSAFLWPHSQQQFTNAWLVGLLVAAVALLGVWVPSVRYVNTVLAVWLFVSSWILPRASTGTIWNHVLVAGAIFLLALVPSSSVLGTDKPMIPGPMASGPHSAGAPR